MANERLRAALLQSGLSVAVLAEEIGVDPKTVERWITQNRIPYRKHRFAVATYACDRFDQVLLLSSIIWLSSQIHL
jgi:transcriptional regulator with XRE-family HTH domain